MICMVDGCDRASRASCMCEKHYRRNRVHGDPLVVIQPKTHGMTGSVEYRTWRNMKRRCYNLRDKNYTDYGGRGIRVCSRWIKSFTNFYEDMGKRPGQDYSLDRIDNSSDYSPDNCRWATAEIQANNTRRNRLLTLDKKTMTLAQWCRERGVNYVRACKRIMKGVTNPGEILKR